MEPPAARHDRSADRGARGRWLDPAHRPFCRPSCSPTRWTAERGRTWRASSGDSSDAQRDRARRPSMCWPRLNGALHVYADGRSSAELTQTHATVIYVNSEPPLRGPPTALRAVAADPTSRRLARGGDVRRRLDSRIGRCRWTGNTGSLILRWRRGRELLSGPRLLVPSCRAGQDRSPGSCARGSTWCTRPRHCVSLRSATALPRPGS